MEKKQNRTFLKSLGVSFLGLVGIIYLLNPTLGVFEIIPDNIPYIGNLDEVGAVLLVISALRYFGIDLFSRSNPKEED